MNNIDVVGGAGLQLRQGIGAKYIPYKLSSNVIDWKEFWFYIENQAPALPARTSRPPVPRTSWNVTVEDLAQVNELLDMIDHLKKMKITGASVVGNWVMRRIQPLQKRANLGYEYTGEDDPSRLDSKKISDADALCLVSRVLDGVEARPVLGEDFQHNSRPREVE